MWKPIEHVRKRREKEKKEKKNVIEMRQWLCCVVLRNVGLWLIFVAIIRTYPYPRIRKKKKRETVPTEIQNNEVIMILESHTHTHTYIYIRVYICRLCDVFQWGESNPLRRIANESMKSKYDLPQNVEFLILFHRKCLPFLCFLFFVFLFKKSNNYVLSGRAWKEGRRKFKISWVASRA